MHSTLLQGLQKKFRMIRSGYIWEEWQLKKSGSNPIDALKWALGHKVVTKLLVTLGSN